MIDEIGPADVVHPLAEAGIHLAKPKQPKVADTEGIESVDPTRQFVFLDAFGCCRTILKSCFGFGLWRCG